VKVNARIRARAVTSNVELKGSAIESTRNFTVEIEGEDKPALSAVWLTLIIIPLPLEGGIFKIGPS
jgi:acyl dehydratase